VEYSALPRGYLDDHHSGLGLFYWNAINDSESDDLEEPLEEEGLAGEIRAIFDKQLETTELAEEEVAEFGAESEQDEQEAGADDLTQAIEEAPEEE
jgi:hypothetical protein